MVTIRVEDAYLSELIQVLEQFTGKAQLPVGSCIVVSSLSHLIRNGITDYILEMVKCIKYLEGYYQGRVRLLCGLTIPGVFVRDDSLIKCLSDMLSYKLAVDRHRRHSLPNSNKKALKMMEEPEGIGHQHNALAGTVTGIKLPNYLF